ncbi:hypothetical protein AALO_G00153250 [Alosa alosa]|uniref:Uncharacterized protein n=1 Tax=Alosa alosa TaxID=278164 RepID=A0AAV6GLB3_9TELE|nr:hypothetical protein AALO_G00153250 [Alosa alosa]
MITPEVVYLGSAFLREALRQAIELTDSAYAHTNERVKTSLSEGSMRPSDLLAQFKQTGPHTRAHIRAAEVLDNTVELIREMVYTHTMATPTPNLTDSTHYGGLPTPPTTAGCPLSMKTSWEPLEAGTLSTATTTSPCPHVLYTHNENISLDSSLSHLLVEWGQWIDHDLVLTPQTPSTAAFKTGADCSQTCSRDTPCFPIEIPLSDPRTGIQSCMPFFRSAPSCFGSVATPPHRHREQLNAITSFVDASMVYGSTDQSASDLRNLSSPLGLLALNPQHSDQGLGMMPFLPRKQSHLDPCGPRTGRNASGAETPPDQNMTSCFQAGDSRANEHLGMIALHTLFLREHNRLARELKQLNPHWSPDTLYQEARKIMGAIHQVMEDMECLD